MGLKRCYDFVQFDDFHVGEGEGSQNVEMLVFGDDEFGVGNHGAIHEFIIVGVGGNHMEIVEWCGEVGMRIVGDNIKGEVCEMRTGVAFKYLGVFGKDFGGDAQGVAPVKEREPQVVVGAVPGDALDEAVGVENQSCHDGGLFSVEVGMSDFIKLLLVEDASIPEAVRLFVEFLLEIVCEHRLNFSSEVLAVVEGKQPEQVHLSGVQCCG